MNWLTVDWETLSEVLVKLTIAFLLSLPIAWNRERATRIMGLRTFPLVAIGSCSYVLIALSFIDAHAADAQARIIQGILTGIGFIGGGAILKDKDKVMGTASAASIWITGALGIAVAYGQFTIAIVLSIGNFFVLRFFSDLKKDLSHND